jgi:DNA polymerase-3 subunit gamma/tau
LVGQEGAAKALTSALRLGRIPQGVLFTGVRGVGKTTTARLYAKALNCASRGDDSEPCNVCESCVAIARGAHEDVLEIDGASNTGVGDVRALQETIAYVPQRSSYRVYIIDEVHMLSQAAFNALLKTLEEPPAHVVFVFATTELAKVPATIIGRCQTFHLSKLPVATIRDRLAAILAKEGLEAEDKALALIAREGHGSMRDALTLLDQAIAIGAGKVTLDSLGPIVSKLSSSPYLDLLTAFVRKDAQSGTQVLETLDGKGATFADVVEQVAAFARHAFVVRDLGVKALDTALLGLDDDEVARLAEIARGAPPLDLNRIFRTLVKCRGDLDGSAIDRYVLENYLFEWCLDPGLPDIDTLLKGGLTGRAATPSSSSSQQGAPQPASSQQAVSQPASPQPAASPAPRTAGKSLLAAFNESIGKAPPSQAQQPAAQAQQPAAQAQQPAAHAQQPAAHAQQPAAHAQQPAAHAQQPAPQTRPQPTPSPQPPKRPPQASVPQPTPPPRPQQAQTQPPRSVAPAATAKQPTPRSSPEPGDSIARAGEGPRASAAAAIRGEAAAASPPASDAPQPESDAGPARASMSPKPALPFPATWRALVDAWKREKPLQARKLEDTHPLRYGEDEITIAVHAHSPCNVLLAREEQLRIKELFRELFGFTGALTVVPAEEALARRGASDGGEAALPDTILTERAREGAERRMRIRTETEKGAFAKEALAVLGGAVEDIAVR